MHTNAWSRISILQNPLSAKFNSSSSSSSSKHCCNCVCLWFWCCFLSCQCFSIQCMHFHWDIRSNEQKNLISQNSCRHLSNLTPDQLLSILDTFIVALSYHFAPFFFFNFNHHSWSTEDYVIYSIMSEFSHHLCFSRSLSCHCFNKEN